MIDAIRASRILLAPTRLVVMPPTPKRHPSKLRRLLSRAAEDWREVAEYVFGAGERCSGPRPLRILRLERRRVLSADFSLVGGGLVLEGFDNPDGDQLAIVQDADEYRFSTEGGWETSDEALPLGVRVDGDTLAVDRQLLDTAPGGLTVADNDATAVDVTFSVLPETEPAPVASLFSASGFAASSSPPSASTVTPGLTLTSLTVTGNLQLLSFGPMADAPGTQILVSGDATFVSRPGSGNPDAGIILADTPGDRFEVGGKVTFDALDGAGRWDISVGEGGVAELGEVTALGGSVVINEADSTTLERIDASHFTLRSEGAIGTTADATIDVTGDASLTSVGSQLNANFNQDGVVDSADRAIWSTNFGIAAGATPEQGDANGDGAVDPADYTVWRNELGKSDVDPLIAISLAERFEVGGQAELIAADGDERGTVTVSDGVTANFGSLAVTGAGVQVWEDGGGTSPGTIVDFMDAGSVLLVTSGPLTDSPGATIATAGFFEALADGPITLADQPSDRLAIATVGRFHANNGGSIDLGVEPGSGAPAASMATIGYLEMTTTSGARVALDGDLVFTGVTNVGSLEAHAVGRVLDEAGFGREPLGTTVRVSGDATLFGAGGIELADRSFMTPDVFEVVGDLRLAVDPGSDINLGVRPVDGDPAESTAAAGTISFVAPEGDVQIALDGPGVLADASEAGSLSLQTIGEIATAPASAGADATPTSLVVSGDAEFAAMGSTGPRAPITLIGDGADAFRFGTLRLLGSQVEVVEGTSFGDASPGTVLAEVSATSLQLTSAGPITDAPDAVIVVDDEARFAGTDEIVLADTNSPGNRLEIGGLGVFLVVPGGGRIDLGVDPSTGDPAESNAQIGSMSLAAIDGDVRVALDGAATFAGDTITGTLAVETDRQITDAAGATISVTESAVFTSEGSDPITLDNPSVNFGDVGFNSFGSAVTLREASGTRLSGVDATTFDLISAGKVEDLDEAVIFVLADSSIEGALGVELGDGGAANQVQLSFFELATIRAGTGQTVSLGVDPDGSPGPGEIVANADADFRSGFALNIIAPGGLVQVYDDATPVATDARALLLAGDWEADTLLLQSADAIFDVSSPGGDFPIADIAVTGDANFRAAAGIVLADGDTIDNRLVVDGLARFEVDSRQNIDVGVRVDGFPADAVFVPGSLSVGAPNGQTRVAVDSAALLAGNNLTETLRLEAAGAITDAPDAQTTVTRSAELNAAGGAADVILGDEAASYSMGSPELFNLNEYLAIAARNVSVQADSAVNVRTGAADADYSGTYLLAATGNVAQVGDDGGLRPLTADRVSLASDGAVLFSAVEVTGDGSEPNLQIKAGEAIDLGAEIDAAVELAARFGSEEIPSTDETALSPVVVEADLADGTRPDQPARSDPGLENVQIDGEPSRLAERAPEGGFLPPVPMGPNMPIDIGDDYSAIVRVVGDATVGDVPDATGASVDTDLARGLVVTTTGNAYLDTSGDLTFSGDGRFDTASDVEVVAMGGGVLTAVAGAYLRIDTDQPDQPTAVARTTKLRSATGVVTSIADGDQSGFDQSPGPRLLLDPSTEEATAATTGLIRADSDFEQRLTVAVGSRGEDNLLIEVEWADAATIRNQSVATLEAGVEPLRESFDREQVPGSSEYAALIQTPVEPIEQVEATTAATGLEYQDLEGEFRVVTIRHNYAESFVPANPAQDTMPTTVRVFNDPAINLFDQGGARDLNSASFTIAPRIITLPPAGYFILSEPDLPTEYVTREVAIARDEPATTVQRTAGDEGRAAVVSSAETVEYGRVDDSGEWMRDIPGEQWPQIRDDAEGDFLREIRDKVDEGPYSEGRYRIQIRTPRGEQLLEEWTKGDTGAEESVLEPGAEAEAEIEVEAINPPTDAALAPASLPAIPPAAATDTPTQAAFAAIAAVGVWRKSLGERGRFDLEEDGVRYTRASRRRRRPA